jgi:trimethylamine--corrinoid protein Co-methyltransferase
MEISDDTRAMETMDRIDPGGHHLGTDHPMMHQRDASIRRSFSITKPSKSGDRMGRRILYELAHTSFRNYELPEFDRSIEEGFIDYMKRRIEEEASKRPQKTKVTAS